jgi:hypothetical protein
MHFIHKLVKKAEGVAQLSKTADVAKLAKTAENMARQIAPSTKHQENEEYFHPEHKKYFSAPKI